MPIKVQTPNGPVEFPDGMPDAEIERILAADVGGGAPPNKLDAALKERGLTDEHLAALDAMDQRQKDSVPAQLSLVGGMLGGAPGAGLGAYTGSRLQGQGLKDSAIAGAESALIPKALGAATGWIGNKISSAAVPAVRAATKQSVAFLRRRAGIEGVTPTAVGNRTARTILQGGFREADDATKAVKALEGQIQEAVSRPGLPALDTAERIPRYISTIARKVEKQITPGQDRSAIQNFGRELVNDSPLSARVGPAADVAAPSLEQSLERILREAMNDGKPALRAIGKTGPSASFAPSAQARALRTDVTPKEGLDISRAKSFFNKDASGASVAAGKATERALRDSVKQAVPEAGPLLRRQGEALDAAKVLEDMSLRTANRDAMSLPGIVGAAPSLAAEKVPVLGMVAQWMRNNQLKAGHAAYKYGPKIARSAPAIDAGTRTLLMALLGQRSEP